jgi:hypothetical protein
MGTDPVLLDASWFSAQHQARLFWGNVPGLGKTVIPPHMNRRAMVEKIRTITTNASPQGMSDYTCNSTLSPQIIKDIRAD